MGESLPIRIVEKLLLRSTTFTKFFYSSKVMEQIRLASDNRILESDIKESANLLSNNDSFNKFRGVSTKWGIFPINANNKHDLLFALAIFNDGVYEKGVTEVVSRYVKTGDICIDIGANNGFYTLLFSRLSGSNGNVISFEPNP